MVVRAFTANGYADDDANGDSSDDGDGNVTKARI